MIYQGINNQLHVQLPDLYDSRVALCIDVLSKLAEAERAFYTELSEVRNTVTSEHERVFADPSRLSTYK